MTASDAARDGLRSFPRSRVDALTDAVFAFAMTLLVLEIRLPANLPIRTGADLTAHLAGLWPEALAYLISFLVLAAQWRGMIELRATAEVTHPQLARWFLYLFFITMVPFSSSVVGHYGDLAPAAWLYAGNMILLGALALLLRRDAEVITEPRARIGRIKTWIFMAIALVSVLISLVRPDYAMYAYLLTLASEPLAARWPGKAP